MKVANFAVAGLHCAGARDQDMEEASRCVVHFRLERRWQSDESESLSLMPLRYGEGRRRIGSEFDNNVLEVALPIRPREQAHVLHVGHLRLSVDPLPLVLNAVALGVVANGLTSMPSTSAWQRNSESDTPAD
jgi:hypothetical protein